MGLRNLIIKAKQFSSRAKKRLPKEFKKLFLFLYIVILLVGLVLTLAYGFVHSLVICTSFFGTQFCTPTGIFLILLVNLPGYIVVGNVLSHFGEIPWFVSFLLVIIFSSLSYFMFGFLIDRQRGKKLTMTSFTKLIIYAVFVILVILLVSLI